MLELPNPRSLLLVSLRPALPKNNDIGERIALASLGIVLVIFELLHLKLGEIIAEHGVVKVDDIAEMSVDDEGTVDDAEFALTRHLKLHHAELLTGCGP